MTDKYHPVTREELEQIAGRCFHPELHDINEYTCDQCEYESIRGVGCNQKITELKDSVLSRPDPLALLEAKRLQYSEMLRESTSCFDEYDRGLIEGKECAMIILKEFVKQLRENPEAVRQQGIKDGWWKE